MPFNYPETGKGWTYIQCKTPPHPEEGETWYNFCTNTVLIYNSYTWKELFSEAGNVGYIPGNASGNLSSIDKLQFPFNSGTTTVVNNLTTSRHHSAGCNSSQHGFFIGGFPTGSIPTSIIDRMSFYNDSATMTIPCVLSQALGFINSCNSSLHGFIMSGTKEGENAHVTNISRITFPQDSGTAVNVGYTTDIRASTSSFNSSIHGFVAGFVNVSSTLNRIIFPFNSGTASNVGVMSIYKYAETPCNSETAGYLCGGKDVSSTVFYSMIERFKFPFNSGTGQVVSSLTNNNSQQGGVNSSSHGYLCGGTTGGLYSNINRMDFIFDSATAITVGKLSTNRATCAGVDNTDFRYQFT